MGASKDAFMQLRQDDIQENMEGLPMYVSPPKQVEPIDYSLLDFEGIVKHHSKFKPDVKKVILDAITEYKSLMDKF